MNQFYVFLCSLASIGYFLLGLSFNVRIPFISSHLGKHFLFALSVICLGSALLPEWFSDSGMQFGFSIAIAWMFWLASVLIWVEITITPESLSARYIFFPAVLGAVLPILLPSPVLEADLSFFFRFHILIAMLAYSSFALAVAQGSIMMAHEASLRKLKQKRITSGMPSLLEMDTSLVRILFVSFTLISATLASGIVINHEVGKNFIELDHKTIFAFAAWVIVLILLVGRMYFGWRGRFAARLTIIGFIFLLFAYIGTQFVLEVLLDR
ncbi:MAG: hypothetical protein CBD16_08470 [Betaproteobacteria bacterium TMED156]|nr:MAG: hypothetical protein CBD16_08470 [Betaproteobacteria bacterium TMED156]